MAGVSEGWESMEELVLLAIICFVFISLIFTIASVLFYMHTSGWASTRLVLHSALLCTSCVHPVVNAAGGPVDMTSALAFTFVDCYPCVYVCVFVVLQAILWR